MKPKISILTTVYNGEKFIEETIKSVLNQTFKDFEYIIVDDGSTDSTGAIVSKFQRKDKRIRYVRTPINRGYFNFHESINVGLHMCVGEYIARIDADDIMYSNRLQKQYDYLEKHKDIFMIGTSVEVIDKKGNTLDYITKKNYPSWLYKWRIHKNSFIHSSIMFRNEDLKYPWYNEHFFYFNMIVNKKKIRNISDVLTMYRINPDGMISKYGKVKGNKFEEHYRR
jgi:glycosyltransferase involved in cell wall biosynthesis